MRSLEDSSHRLNAGDRRSSSILDLNIEPHKIVLEWYDEYSAVP